jgi:hypothetical protein
MFRGAKAAVLAFLLAEAVFAQQQSAKAPATSPVLDVEGLGQGAVPLDGPWQFHAGDNPGWASPSFDDSGWEPIQVAGSWGGQSHPGYTGYAWYRRHVQIHTVGGSQSKYALLMPPVDDAYEVYWNGKPIGRFGKLPPRPRWHYSSLIRSFDVSSLESGTIAVRV